jgi:hypothetical protein
MKLFLLLIILLSLPSCQLRFGWPLYRTDVKTAFLNGAIEEEVCVCVYVERV